LAVLCPDGATSYGVLRERTCQWAQGLQVEGIRAGDRVLIQLDDLPETLAAMLACLCLGVIYVGLDPAVPVQRWLRIVEDAEPAALVTSEERAIQLRAGGTPIPRIRPQAGLSPEALRELASRLGTEAIAYVAYTSGTTGLPKGVVHSQANLLHEVRVHTANLELGRHDRFSVLYSPAVIGSVRDLFGALLNGATLCPFPFRTRGFRALADWLKSARVTQYHSVPVLFREMARVLEPGEILPDLRVVFLAGDVVTPSDVALTWRHTGPGCRFYTGIGSSEATSIYTHWFVPRDWDLTENRLPTGKPIQEKEVRVVDRETGKPAAVGEVGEIEVWSRFLARGYWRRVDLTASAFLMRESGVRSYRTGDLGWFDARGWLWHVGRADRQVKLRGVRVELSEVEAALTGLAGVNRAATRVWPGPGGEPRLVAYLELNAGEPETGTSPDRAAGVDPTEWRRTLASVLPDAAIPSQFIVLDALPLTATLKIDFQSLPEPALATPPVVRGSSPPTSGDPAASRGRVERIRLAFAAALECPVDAVPLTADFRSLGGDSLQLVRLALELEKSLGQPVPIDFAGPLTVAEIARQGGVASLKATQRPAVSRPMEAIVGSWTIPAGAVRHPTAPVVCLGGVGDGRPCLVWLSQGAQEMGLCEAAAAHGPVVMVPSGYRVIQGDDASTREWVRQLATWVHEAVGDAPVVMGGYCCAGSLAVWLAVEWRRLGRSLEGLLLVETFGSPWAVGVARWLLVPWVIAWRPMLGLPFLDAVGHFRCRLELERNDRRVRRELGLPAPGAAFPGVVTPPLAASIQLLVSQQTWRTRWLMPWLGWSRARHPGLRLDPIAGDHLNVMQPSHWQQVVQAWARLPGPARPDTLPLS
jgi:amino acid adenylation domain-containing protein